MKFWDSSALCSLLLTEAHSVAALRIFNQEPDLVVWWATPVELQSAIWTALRRNRLTENQARQAETRLQHLSLLWTEIQPDEEVRREATRAVRVHDIRTGDAFQLAAAILAGRRSNQALEFVCFDRRLGTAALREGLAAINTEERPT